MTISILLPIYNIAFFRCFWKANPSPPNPCAGTIDNRLVVLIEYRSDLTLDESVKHAVKYCIENKILNNFLETHSSEVFNMLSTEWNWEDALEVAREEGWEDGHEEGMEKAHEEDRQYFLELLNQGLTIDEIKQRLNQKETVI
jgi:hypothetical protein